jgi:adenylate cyclase
MTETETRRKLTTIMSADVQDYTRLMGADEEGTLTLLKQYRDSMARLIAAHGGRVINTWGDGLIAEFPSVVEAVRAAVDTQNELSTRNEARSPDSRMLFRIGINLGDVIADGDDIYGDGVNIAARLQSQAEPGGIVISSTVYDQVRNKVPVAFDFLGALAVKNVEEAIPSYAVRVGDAAHVVQPAHQASQTPPRQHDTLAGMSPPDSNAPTSPELARAMDGLTRYSGRFLQTLGIAAAVILLINIFTWHGEFWAAWPLLFIATIAAFTWSKRQSATIWRFGPPLILSLMLLGINILSWSGTLWAQWPILGIAIATAVRQVARRS